MKRAADHWVLGTPARSLANGHSEVIAKNGALSYRQLPWVAVSHSSHNRRPNFQQPSGAHRRRCHSNRPPLWNLCDRDATDFFCSALPAHIARPIPHRLSSSAGQPFSTAHFSGHCFRLIPASCSFAASAFPVPPLHHWVPSHKAATRFGSSSPRLWVPQKSGAEKGDISMSYLYVKWNSLGVVARQQFSHYSMSCLSLATPGTKACDAVGGALRP